MTLEGDDLRVVARFAPGIPLAGSAAPHVDDDAAPYVHDLAASTEGGWGVLRYRFALRQAGRERMDPETALARGTVVVAPPSTWLLHPDQPTPGSFRFHVTAGLPDRFVGSTHVSLSGAADTYEAPTDTLDDAAFAVFGPFDQATFHSGPSTITVASAPDQLGLSPSDVTAWVKCGVDGIAAFLGRSFPVRSALVVVIRGQGGVTRGMTMGDGGPGVLIRAGDEIKPGTTRDDWVMTHELIHVTMPQLAHDHIWLAEGIASYVEPLVRVRAGTLTPEKLWRDLVEGLPQGLPEKGDEGLERTHTWGRTYWGGSLFCLMADVHIREQTGGSRSFQDVIKAIVAKGANVEAHWEVDQVLDVGDAATGTRALHEAYRDLALAPGTVDLAGLWHRLGVQVEGDRVSFDDSAPLAGVRRSIAGR